MYKKMLGMGLASVLTLAWVGCGDDTAADPDGATPDSGVDTVTVAPTVDFKDLKEYDGIKGTTSISVEVNSSVEKVELLADGKAVAESKAAPFKISFDSTKASDGIVKLKLKAYAGSQSATSDEVKVVIYNKGQKVIWLDGNSGTMTVQTGMDNHVKHHWTMPDEIRQVIVVGWWVNTAFKMELAIGTGTCPHSGVQAAAVKSDTTPIATTYTVAKGTIPCTKWFAHYGATNETDLTGKSTTYSMEAYLLK